MIFAIAIVFSTFLNVEIATTHDGDTLEINLPDEQPIFGDRLGVRLKGIDTAELHDKRKCAREDAELAQQALSSLIDGKQVDLNFCTRDKFFRANCFVKIGPVDASAYLLDRGLAVPYSGGKKQPWKCLKLSERD